MSVTGNNGKLWENAGISEKNREAVIEKREIMGNSGKNWNNVRLPSQVNRVPSAGPIHISRARAFDKRVILSTFVTLTDETLARLFGSGRWQRQIGSVSGHSQRF